MTLIFSQTEKRMQDTIVFPSFDLTISEGQVISLFLSVNMRELLLDILLGKTKLSNGEIQISKEAAISYYFLEHHLYHRLTVREMLTFTKKLYQSMLSIEHTLLLAQLDQLAKTKISKLTYSEKKRVQLACIVMQQRSIIVMEEPDQNIDLESKRTFQMILQKLRSEGKAVCILTSNLESAITAADEVYRLDQFGLHIVQLKESEQLSEDTKVPLQEEPSVRFEKIPTKVQEKIVLFNPPEIDYIESNEGQSHLYINGESFPCTFTLQELESRLLPFGFFRCHRSYIVNLQKVREVLTWTRNSYSLVLDDRKKSTIPLSKSKMAELKEMLGL